MVYKHLYSGLTGHRLSGITIVLGTHGYTFTITNYKTIRGRICNNQQNTTITTTEVEKLTKFKKF